MKTIGQTAIWDCLKLLLLLMFNAGRKVMSMNLQIVADATFDAGIVTKALVSAARKLEINDRELADVLHTSEDVSREILKGQRQVQKDDPVFDTALLFLRLFRSLDTVCAGDETTAASWLRNSNSLLNGKPMEKISTLAGLKETIAYLDTRRAPV
jgi:hypothetical protein